MHSPIFKSDWAFAYLSLRNHLKGVTLKTIKLFSSIMLGALLSMNAFGVESHVMSRFTRSSGGETKHLGLNSKPTKLSISLTPAISRGETQKSYAKLHISDVVLGTIDGGEIQLTTREMNPSQSEFEYNSGRMFVYVNNTVTYEVESDIAIESLHIHAESYSAYLDLNIAVHVIEEGSGNQGGYGDPDDGYHPPTNPYEPPVNPYTPPTPPAPVEPECDYRDLQVLQAQMSSCTSQNVLLEREASYIERDVYPVMENLNACQNRAREIRSEIQQHRSRIDRYQGQARSLEASIAEKRAQVRFIQQISSNPNSSWRCQVVRSKNGGSAPMGDVMPTLAKAMENAIISKCGDACYIPDRADAKKHKFQIIPYGRNKTINCEPR